MLDLTGILCHSGFDQEHVTIRVLFDREKSVHTELLPVSGLNASTVLQEYINVKYPNVTTVSRDLFEVELLLRETDSSSQAV